MTMPGHNPDFYPISFWDVWGTNNFIVGQELLKGENLGFPNKWSDSLNYEIVGGNYDFVIVNQYGEHPISIHTGITKATSAVGKTGRRAYDLQGRPVSGKQRHGLYIWGGRVRVAE